MQNDGLKKSYLQRLSQLSVKQKAALANKLGILPDKTNAKLVACVTMAQGKAVNNNDLKEFAQTTLPEHSVPQIFKQVEALPRASTGKIKRRGAHTFAWQALTQVEDDQGDDIFGDDIFGENTYAAPTNETETTLAKIWSEVLGAGDISIHDEFLEVGGDSLLSIRILARINKAGLSIATEDFFRFPTIAGQAKAINKAGTRSYEQGSTKGKFALLPIQHWLFERIQINPQQWNQSVLLAVDEQLDFAALERAFQKVLLQHDALRLAFMHNDSQQWQQEYMPLPVQLPITRLDCSAEIAHKQTALIRQHCESLDRSMKLAEGNLARLAFFETQIGQPNKLAIVIHHLTIDAESWRILLEDLHTCWLGFAQGKTPVLPRKTSSFKHWSEKLVEYAQSEVLNDEVSYWQSQTSLAKIPVDQGTSPNNNTHSSEQIYSFQLDIEKTALLLHELPKRLKVSVKDALIASLVTVIHKWSQNEEILIDIEGHGREDIFENVDISRTIGWFTTVFPVLFKMHSTAQPLESLLYVSKTLNAVPKKGIGHGVLRENRSDSLLKQQRYSEVCFNYLGQVNASSNLNDAKLLTPLANNIGEARSATCLRAFKIEVNAKVEGEQLTLDWSYSDSIHNKETIMMLAADFTQALVNMLSLDAQPETENNEDDDLFDLTDLEDDELDAISKALKGDT